jgi:adenylate cyclase
VRPIAAIQRTAVHLAQFIPKPRQTRLGTEMADSAPPENASRPDPVARPAVSRWAKLWERLKRFRGPIAAVAALGAVLSGLVGYWRVYETVQTVVAPKSASVAVMPSPFAMSVAVLPIAGHSGSSADVHLADTLTSNVTSILSRDRWTRVVAHRQVGSSPSEPKDPLRLGRELHVRYLTAGELHRDGAKVVVLMRLIDAETGADAWSDRFEFEATQLESEQIRAAERVERRLWDGVLGAAKRHAKANPVSSDPWNLFLRASDMYEREGNRAVARKQIEEVLRLDPDFVPALATEADIIMAQLSDETEATSLRVSQQMEALDRISSRAVVLGPSDSYAWEVRAEALMWLGRWQEALAASDRSRALDPGSVYRVLDRAYILIRVGRPNEALSVIQQAHAMEPEIADTGDASYFSVVECVANHVSGNYREATPHCEQAGASGDSWRAQARLAALYAQQGEMDKAAAAKSAALKLKPTISIAQLKAMPQSGSPLYLDLLETHYYSGLRKAGFPEQ